MPANRRILHLDLDAFYASVEQRDKPSLRGKAVVVGGVNARGVVATASYEARAFGVHSAMPSAEARRRAPHAAYLGARFEAYRQSSRIVMDLLHELSPIVEPLSLDEAYVELPAHWTVNEPQLAKLVDELRAELTERTEGLHASVGVGGSKFMAKLASEQAKPNGQRIIAPGSELAVISSLPVKVIPGVGHATNERLAKLGIQTVADLQAASRRELIRELGQANGNWLHELAFARDDRPVTAHREAKSISVEDTFPQDLREPAELDAILVRDATLVAARLTKAGLFARTITIKARLGDFTTFTRSRTLEGATDQADKILDVARGLLAGLDLSDGVRLLGVGTSNFAFAAQEELFADEHVPEPFDAVTTVIPARRRNADGWTPGQDIEHDEFGRGWVWGAGQRVVTVRFESRHTDIGPVRSFDIADPALHRADLLPMAWAKNDATLSQSAGVNSSTAY